MVATLSSLLAYANTRVEPAVFDMPASVGNEKAASPNVMLGSEPVVILMDVGAGTTVSATVWGLAAAQLPSAEAGKETVKVTEPAPVIVTSPDDELMVATDVALLAYANTPVEPAVCDMPKAFTNEKAASPNVMLGSELVVTLMDGVPL